MTEIDVTTLWVYLSTTPLLGLTATFVAYGIAHRLYTYTNNNALLNPVVVSVGLLICFLVATGTSYGAYFEGAQFVHFLLGPATVALAVPLYQQWAQVKKIWLAVAITLIIGVTVGALSSVIIAQYLGATLETQLSLAPKSVTAPVAMGIAESIGGLPSLTAVMVMATGVSGAIMGTQLLALFNINDDRIKGVAMGIAAHGIGTARAFQVSRTMGAFSGLAMALSALTAALLLPWLVGQLALV